MEEKKVIRMDEHKNKNKVHKLSGKKILLGIVAVLILTVVIIAGTCKTKQIKISGLSYYTEAEVKTKFGALYTAFQYGAPPHAGMAPGIDRMIMLLTESDVIRDVIAFPMNSKAEDLLMGAPGNVSKEQLEDVHIKLDIKNNLIL